MGAVTFGALLLMAIIAVGYVSDNPIAVIVSNIRPYAAVLLALAGIALAGIGRYGRGALFGVAAVATFAQLGATFYQHRADWAAAREKAADRTLTLVNFNVFDRNREDSSRIASALADSKADILVLTEAIHLNSQIAELQKRYPYSAGCTELTNTCDTVIFSTYPTSESTIRNLGPIFPNRFVSTKITIGSDQITVVAIHLVKPYFDNHGRAEVEHLVHMLDELPGPLLLAGDFNAAPWSRNIALLLSETQLLAGPLPVATWPSRIGSLGIPIDHVFTRAPMVLERVAALPDSLGSNHRGLLAHLRF